MTKMDDFVLGVAVVAFSVYGYGLYSSRLAGYRGKLGWLASSWPFGRHYE